MADLPENAVTLRAAADILGVSVDTLRRRAQRYQKRGEPGPFLKQHDEWYVILPETRDTEQDTLRDTATNAITAGEQFARVIEQAIAPYAARLEAIAIDLGRERERREEAERERDELRARLDALESPETRAEPSTRYPAPDESNVAQRGSSEATEASTRPRRSWLRRIFLGEG